MIPLDVPRRNGELVFAAPWEARAFGVAVAYVEASGRGWEEFRRRLMAAIARLPPTTAYYEAWTDALTDLVAADAVASPSEIAARAQHAPSDGTV